MTRKSILVLVAIICLALRLGFAYRRALVPFEMDYEEGNILNAGVRLLHGVTPYPDPGSFPYVLNPYGPVGYLLTAAGVRAFGLSLLGPRLLVFFAGIGIFILMTILTRRLGARWQAGVLFGALYLCSPLVWTWFPLLRVDLWAILLSLLGLYLFRSLPRAWYLAAVVLALAILTKHTALAAPLACFLELVTHRKWRRAMAFAALVTASVVACVLSLGHNFAFDLLKTHPDPYRIQRVLELYSAAIGGSLIVLAVALYAAAAGFRWNERSRLAWLYLAACCATAFTAGKLGSETNHFLEWTAAVSLTGALALSYLLERQPPVAKFLEIGLVVVLALFASLPQRSIQASVDQKGCRDAYAFVASFGGDRILSEDVAALVLAGKPVLVSNPFVVTQLGSSVAWSQGSMEQLVKQRYFDLIVLGGDVENYEAESGRWSPSLIRAVAEGYRPERRFQCSSHFAAAYVPKSKSR